VSPLIFCYPFLQIPVSLNFYVYAFTLGGKE